MIFWGGLKTETGNLGGSKTNWQFGGVLKTESGNSETGNNIWGGSKNKLATTFWGGV